VTVAAFVHAVEIARSPEDVFAYLSDLGRHGEWQEQIVSVTVETEGPTGVGSRAREIRKVPGGKRDLAYEITEFEAPRRVAFKGVNGPVRVLGAVTVEGLEQGSGSRVTIHLDFESQGLFGKLVAPLARRQAAKQVPRDHAMLKERLESAGV
jgi:uncharacterized membrane protein